MAFSRFCYFMWPWASTKPTGITFSEFTIDIRKKGFSSNEFEEALSNLFANNKKFEVLDLTHCINDTLTAQCLLKLPLQEIHAIKLNIKSMSELYLQNLKKSVENTKKLRIFNSNCVNESIITTLHNSCNNLVELRLTCPNRVTINNVDKKLSEIFINNINLK